MTETVPEPERRDTGGGVELPGDHQGDTEDAVAGRDGDSVESTEPPPEW